MMKFLLGNEKTAARQSYIWNSAAGIINAVQSTIFLMFIMRVGGEVEGGVFTIGFATANLLLCIGKFGVRTYQISDLRGQFTFGGYLAHRLTTTGIMLAIAALYCAVAYLTGGYSREKAWVCLFLCTLKMVDAIEDVYHGEYHRQGRLDIAGRAITLRLVLTFAAFGVIYLVCRNLALTFALCTAISFALFMLIARAVNPHFDGIAFRPKPSAIRTLLGVGFPLFFSAFLSMFIISAPKYAIDFILEEADQVQAVFGIISMPVFLIGLLMDFMLKPILTTMTRDWQEQRYDALLHRVRRMMLYILGVTACCVAGGVTLGVPVLELMFHTKLSAYRLELGILLACGGLQALHAFYMVLLTIIRKHRVFMAVYSIAAVLAVPILTLLTRRMGMLGATIGNATVISSLCLMMRFELRGFFRTCRTPRAENNSGDEEAAD